MALTQERLKELLTYNPETGLFHWLVRTSNRTDVGKQAGHCEKRLGYVLIELDGRLYQAQRLAWLYMHGHWPEFEIDHENGNPSDNRFLNLRAATHSQNLKNVKRPSHNTSGFKGVHLHRQSGRWRARIRANGKYYSLGLHTTKELAHAAYREGAIRLHGEFARFQ
jgi:hypothetical protein